MFKIILFLLPMICAQNLKRLDTLQIKNFELSRCSNTNDDPISLKDITVQIGDNPRLLISGIFTSLVDLNPAITAVVKLKRKVIFWIEVPCEKNLGSCTYDDLCSFGVPENQTCPNVFVRNKVPCRCPIKKGTYILPKSIDIPGEMSVLTGSYKGTVTVYSGNQRLACYNFNFQLYDAIKENSVGYYYYY